MKKKQVFSLLLCAALMVALLPTAVLADGVPISRSVQNGNIEISAIGTYVISGNTTLYTIRVDENVGSEDTPVNITLDNVSIEMPFSGGCAFSIGAGSYVNLTLSGDNTLKSGSSYAGLCVPNGATLNISEDSATTDTDSLSATSVCYGAGIGGNGGLDYGSSGGDCGTVTISSGKITADGSSNGAGIGGGAGSSSGGSGGTVTISGGTVTATGDYGAGIGGGNCFDFFFDKNCGGNGGTLTISGGTVTAASKGFGAGIGGGGAGIGGGISGGGGTVTISGGTTTAAGGGGGAGIGGGIFGDGGTATISGGTITATGGIGGDSGVGTEGAGIGGGANGNGGSVYISGGNVYASSVSGEAIGKGSGGSNSGTLQNNSTEQTPVCLTTVMLQNVEGLVVGNMSVSSITVGLNGSAYAYGTKDMQTDADGKLYLYLPADVVVTAAQAAGHRYLGSVTAASDSAASHGTLMLSSIIDVTPEGTDAPVNGNLALTFIGEMDPSVTGMVSLNGGAMLTGGAWSDGNTVYTVPYAGLSYSMAYTVVVSGFKDAVGNAMVPDSTNGFTTCVAPHHSAGDNSVYYTIRSSAGTGGSIRPSGNTTVKKGNDQIYTVTANDRYEIKDVLVDGTSVGAVDFYTFENVKKVHTITVSFEEKQVVNPFIDVTDGDWFYDSVLYVYDKGLMNGTGSDTFSPNVGSMTRGMFVTVLYRLSGDTGGYTSGFADVPSGKWYENAVAWATQNGISGGVGNNRFAPESGITREQLAVLLYNYAKYKGYDVSIGQDMNILSYKDALDISDYAYPAFQWACGAGIMNGDSGYLSPNGPTTRAQGAAMLERFIENIAS